MDEHTREEKDVPCTFKAKTNKPTSSFLETSKLACSVRTAERTACVLPPRDFLRGVASTMGAPPPAELRDMAAVVALAFSASTTSSRRWSEGGLRAPLLPRLLRRWCRWDLAAVSSGRGPRLPDMGLRVAVCGIACCVWGWWWATRWVGGWDLAGVPAPVVDGRLGEGGRPGGRRRRGLWGWTKTQG